MPEIRIYNSHGEMVGAIFRPDRPEQVRMVEVVPEEVNVFGMRVIASDAVPHGEMWVVSQDAMDAAAMAVRSRRIQVEAWASQQLYTNWGEGGPQVDPVRHARLDQMTRRGLFKSERLTLGFSSCSDRSKFDGMERCDGCLGSYDLFNVAITELGFMCAVCRSA